MLIEEFKECLSEFLDYIENTIDELDFVRDQDKDINNCYDELIEIYEKIRLKYEK